MNCMVGSHPATIATCFLVLLLIPHSSTQSILDSQTNNGFNPVHRTKRSSVRGQHRHYPYGIVPYSFHGGVSATQRGIIRRVMELYQHLTCIRFVPRISRDGQWAKDLYNLGHNGFIDFVQEDSCFGGIGNNNGRTAVSCCGRNVCIREIGHALGQIHEHQSPNRDGYIRVNDRIIPAVQKIRYMKNLPSDVLGNFLVDISSPMNSELGDSNNKVELLTTDVSTDIKDFYMFQEISMAHRCRENNCSNFNTECLNDGYVTLIHGSCRCRCPEGLNPDTGCRTVISENRANERCGGVFYVTDDNPTVTFTKPRNLTVECSWLINAPVGDTIKLDFNEFNISRLTECDDQVEIRHSRIGQGGKMFCGTEAPGKIKSYFNRVMVTFLPPRVPRHLSYFNATARLVSARTLCYNPQDKGYTYDGTVNYTRDYTPCIEWSKAAHCPYNPYNFKDLGSNLNNNYCRNPGNGVTPWCYVNVRKCQRKYCDVCMLDTPVDNGRNCVRTIRWYNYCSYYRQESLRTCAKTCAHELFSVQPSAMTVRCLPPPSLSDTDQIDKLNQTSFAVGDVVTFRCRHVNRLFRTELRKYCLTSGNWTVGNTACLPCPIHKGYVLHDGSCYSVQTQRKTANQHQRTCELDGGHLAYVKTVEEQEFVTDLAFSLGASDLYIGPNDMYREDVFRYRDYLPITWANWDNHSRNHRHKDCVKTNIRNTWVVERCRRRLQAVCKTPMLRHRRLGLADCSDSRDDCQDLLDKDGQMCHRGGGGFGVTQCPLTCGKCI